MTSLNVKIVEECEKILDVQIGALVPVFGKNSYYFVKFFITS